MEEQKKSVRIPNFIRNLVYWTERIHSNWALKLVLYFFFKPVKFPTPDYEEPALSQAELLTLEGPKNKTLQLYRWGSGPQILLTHGWSGRGTQLGLIALALVREGYEVISFDAPSHGKSTGNKTDLLEFVDSIRRIKKAFPDVQQYVGHSMGGLASLHAATTDDSIEKITVIGTPNKISEIVDNFCRMIKASPDIAERIKRHIEVTFGYDLEEYDSSSAIRQLSNRRGFLLHDINDYDVAIHNAKEMKVAWGDRAIYRETEGLGHRRILRDPGAIQAVVNFVKG